MKGYGIFIGVNSVDDRHYESNKSLGKAKSNAQNFVDFAQQYIWYDKIDFLTGKQASWELLEELLWQYAKKSIYEEGFLFLTFSGHGLSLSKRDDKDVDDWQFLCFYDRMVLEHEFTSVLERFSNKFKIVLIVDSCYSGGFIASRSIATRKPISKKKKKIQEENAYNKNPEYYDPILDGFIYKQQKEPNFDADVIFYASSSKNRAASIGTHSELTAYTQFLMSILNAGKFTGSYHHLNQLLKKGLIGENSPGCWSDRESLRTFFCKTSPFDINQESERFDPDDYLRWTIKWDELENNSPAYIRAQFSKLKYRNRGLNKAYSANHPFDPGVNKYLNRNKIDNVEIVVIIYVALFQNSEKEMMHVRISNLVSITKSSNPNTVALIYDSEHSRVLGHKYSEGRLELTN